MEKKTPSNKAITIPSGSKWNPCGQASWYVENPSEKLRGIALIVKEAKNPAVKRLLKSNMEDDRKKKNRNN